jgi:hypothetical protein
LSPRGGRTAEQYKRDGDMAAANSGILRLGYEYHTNFGRSALDDLLERSVPDTAYAPGEIHKLLLSLPWSDVFTTNWDTLLEKTVPLIHGRRYDLVLTMKDLPRRSRPRIVKLHGSLPSHRPFILTEEDYRRYPREFAPLVSTVQQSLMENEFVLLGFSGEDPNFLQWIGWVRDNLGEACPRIYLCGSLGLTSSRRRLLEALNVVPIDLDPLFPRGSLPEGVRQRKAIRWFLYSLRNGQPPDPLSWPEAEVPPAPSDLGQPLPDQPTNLAAEVRSP